MAKNFTSDEVRQIMHYAYELFSDSACKAAVSKTKIANTYTDECDDVFYGQYIAGQGSGLRDSISIASDVISETISKFDLD